MLGPKILITSPCRIVFYPETLGSARIAVRFIVASAYGIILHGTDTIACRIVSNTRSRRLPTQEQHQDTKHPYFFHNFYQLNSKHQNNTRANKNQVPQIQFISCFSSMTNTMDTKKMVATSFQNLSAVELQRSYPAQTDSESPHKEMIHDQHPYKYEFHERF